MISNDLCTSVVVWISACDIIGPAFSPVTTFPAAAGVLGFHFNGILLKKTKKEEVYCNMLNEDMKHYTQYL